MKVSASFMGDPSCISWILSSRQSFVLDTHAVDLTITEGHLKGRFSQSNLRGGVPAIPCGIMVRQRLDMSHFIRIHRLNKHCAILTEHISHMDTKS